MSTVSIRYIIDDVPAAMHFYTTILGFTVEHDASQCLRDVHGDERIRRVVAHGVVERFPEQAVPIVEAHQRDLHEPRAFIQQGNEMPGVESAFGGPPQP